MYCGSDTWRGSPASKCAERAEDGKKAGSRAKRGAPTTENQGRRPSDEHAIARPGRHCLRSAKFEGEK